jgi:alkylation response protein AidB-like acyl-CoA dehydrogenase
VFYTLARIVAPVLIRWATDEQKAEFLPPITKAEICVWQVLTEPHGGRRHRQLSDQSNSRRR